VRQRIDLGVLAFLPVNTAKASKGILPVDVHGAATANALTAGAAEGERRVHLVLDFDERIEDHGAALVQVNLV
jgi:hypothetical protein